MKLTRNQAFKLNGVLKGLSKIKNKKFAYLVVKNTRILDAEFEAIKTVAINGTPAKYTEFEDKKKTLILKYALKNEDGTFKVKGKNYDFGENETVVNEEYNKLQIEYSEAIAENSTHIAEVDRLLEEEIELELLTAKFEDFPDELDAEELDLLEVLITK